MMAGMSTCGQARRILLPLVGVLFLNVGAHAQTDRDAGWTGNFAKNPGFEEDFVNVRAEGHVLSFKGDWFYNQKDLIPDCWDLKGEWSWQKERPRSGGYCLKLTDGATASQSFPGAAAQSGGGAWGGAVTTPMQPANPQTFSKPWRAVVWVRNGGSIQLGDAVARALPTPEWQKLVVELPADKLQPAAAMGIVLSGPGEFDDLLVQEQRSGAPNLIPNSGFEEADGDGHPVGWSPQKKYHTMGPTYYVWTDWNHYFRENRGAVTVDPLVSYAGNQSVRFDVYPGDEKYIESEPIMLNQVTPGIIEVAAYVRADRIKLIDIVCVSDQGADLPGWRPSQPEYYGGGTATWGNGTFGWRYVRKFFAMPFDQPIKSVRVRLCARGFNAHTLDDAGTRSYACQVGTVWWDNLHVAERGTDAAALSARGVVTAPTALDTPGLLASADLDLGERLYGRNRLRLSFTNTGKAAEFKLRLTTALGEVKPVESTSAGLAVAAQQRGTLEVPYDIGRLAGSLEDQGTLHVELLRDGKPFRDAVYAFNTWPVVIDFDVARHYNLPGENPVTVAMNLGVTAETLTQVARLERRLAKAADPSQVIQVLPPVTDLNAAFAETLAALPSAQNQSYEFNLPTPSWWTDRGNLIVFKMDLAALKVWPHDEPTRDTVLVVQGVDAAGKPLFSGQSDPFCRVAAPPAQEAIRTVEVRREDGAILINGQPRFLTGATHQHIRLTHSLPIIAQLGLMGHRLTQGMKTDAMDRMWTDQNLYALQAKPDPAFDGTAAVVEMNEEQKTRFKAWVDGGGMRNIVSINTGGWEAQIPDTPEARSKHQACNDWIYQTAQRPLAWSPSGAFNAWNIPIFPYYGVLHGETEMWGPMDYDVIAMPYLVERERPSTWVYLPQLYDNHPFERLRFETYENIIRGSAGYSFIQGIGDATFNRGLAGELRYLENRLYSLEKTPEVTFTPDISHKVTRSNGKTCILACNAGPITLGRWTWHTDPRHSGRASHEGDTVNSMWSRPNGIRIHGFRNMSMPERIQPDDKIVQYVWLDPEDPPDWAMLAVRGNGKFIHNAVLGAFDFEKFKKDYGNVIMFSELNHSVWHEIWMAMDEATYELAVKLMGREWADSQKSAADQQRAHLDKIAYQAEHFRRIGDRPEPGRWVRMELDAEAAGLAGKLVDGVAYLTQNGRALWDYTVIERKGEVARVLCEDSVGIDRSLLGDIRIGVPGLAAGTRIKVLFEDRTIVAQDGFFSDNFEGVDTYQYEAGGVAGDMFGYVKDPNRELPRMMPSGYGYSYGPTAVHIYEFE